MLDLDGHKRPTAAEALQHGYFARLHDPDDEPVAEPVDMSFEERELTLEQWKSTASTKLSLVILANTLSKIPSINKSPLLSRTLLRGGVQLFPASDSPRSVGKKSEKSAGHNDGEIASHAHIEILIVQQNITNLNETSGQRTFLGIDRSVDVDLVKM